MRARSCWCSGASDWMRGTVDDQTFRKDMKAGGQFSCDRSSGADVFVWRGRGTEGGDVVHLNAAKYKHRAGPIRWEESGVGVGFATRTVRGTHL